MLAAEKAILDGRIETSFELARQKEISPAPGIFHGPPMAFLRATNPALSRFSVQFAVQPIDAAGVVVTTQ
jgi:hypothetical protein